MIIADKLKSTNRAEYLLYLWQVEDIIRAYQCDEERIIKEYTSRFHQSPEIQKSIDEWYTNLCEMMHNEGKTEHGHLQICKNILQSLCELNAELLKSTKFPYYKEMYYKVLPYIVELRNKHTRNASSQEIQESEIETCFDFLYGILILKLQKKDITPETQRAMIEISAFLGQLSDYYLKDKETPLEF